MDNDQLVILDTTNYRGRWERKVLVWLEDFVECRLCKKIKLCIIQRDSEGSNHCICKDCIDKAFEGWNREMVVPKCKECNDHGRVWEETNSYDGRGEMVDCSCRRK